MGGGATVNGSGMPTRQRIPSFGKVITEQKAIISEQKTSSAFLRLESRFRITALESSLTEPHFDRSPRLGINDLQASVVVSKLTRCNQVSAVAMV